MLIANAYAAPSADGDLIPTTIERRDVGPHDVLIEIKYAGICHSDIHTVRGDWGPQQYPLAPGHEIAGIVTEVGTDVTKHSVGDRVGVGCMVNSCGDCVNCMKGEEQYCLAGNTGTYGAVDRDGTITQGGYSTHVVVTEDFVVTIPEGIELDAAAPLLCAGITTYSPLRHWGAGPGKKVAVVGLGGLGHMAVKIAHAMGAEVTVLSQSLKKQEDGLQAGRGPLLRHQRRDHLHGPGRQLRPDHQHRQRIDRHQLLPAAAVPRRRPGERRCPGRTAAGERVRTHRRPPVLRRLHDRRHPRNPGNARLLRRAQPRRRDRGHPGRARSTKPTSASWHLTSATASSSTPPRSKATAPNP